MLIEKRSFISGVTHTMDIDVTNEQLVRINNRFVTNELIQNIVPHLDADEREFLMTGITKEEWGAMDDED
jgi:hypothetical protein